MDGGRSGPVSGRTAMLTWWVLLGLTGIAAWLSSLPPQAGLVVLPLALTAVKGQLIGDLFMGLARAPWPWRLAISAYVWSICTIVGLVYLA